jgi:hypothetical protein
MRGRGDEPWALERLPAMGDLRAFARVELRGADKPEMSIAPRSSAPDAVRVPLRVMPSLATWRNVTATWISPAQIPLLRRLAYALPHQTIVAARIAVTPKGAFLRSPTGIEAIPLGTFFVEVHPGLYVPAGYEVTPAVAPDVLYRALGAAQSQVLFIGTDANAVSVEDSAFAPLETALLEAKPWEPLVHDTIEKALEEAPIELTLVPLGMMPMRGAASAGPAGARSLPEGGGPSPKALPAKPKDPRERKEEEAQ